MAGPRTPPPYDGARTLQDRLHRLITKLTETTEHVRKWPEASGDNASRHVTLTSTLISKIRDVIECLQRVESSVKDDLELREKLQKCRIPLDLLDVLDSSNLNPECFSRGLLRESLGQLAGLKRRKLALELLGAAVQSGIQKRQQANNTAVADPSNGEKGPSAGVKRSRTEEDEDESERPAKKTAIGDSVPT